MNARADVFQRQVSPPTRGWTGAGGARCGGEPGFPAHAGMDP